MEQAHKQLGTSKDSVQLRQKLHDIEKTTNGLVSEPSKALHQLCALCTRPSESTRIYKLQCQRLMAEFKEVTQRYNVLQKKVAEKVRLTNAPAAPPSAATQPRVPTGDLLSWGDANEEEQKQQQDRQQFQDQMRLVQEGIDVEVAILQERENQIRQLEADVLDVNAIFRELGLLVHEQGEVIDTIEANVTVAHDNVEEGREQLQRAARYQTSSRKKMCILLVCLVVIVAIIVIAVVIAVKVH
jgi:hypothetical protein